MSATHWYEGMDTTDDDGLVHAVGELRGAHQYAVIGMDEERRLFKAVQSWGDEWGVDGYFYLTYDDMEMLLADDGDCTQMVPLNVPTPRASAIVYVEPGWLATKLSDASKWLTRKRRDVKVRRAKRQESASPRRSR